MVTVKKINFNGKSGGVVEVNILPTDNIESEVIYKISEVRDVNVYIKREGYNPSTLEEAIIQESYQPDLTYHIVDNLPLSPNISNLTTFNPVHVYIYEDIPYIFTYDGNSNKCITVSSLVSSFDGLSYEDRGFVRGIGDVFKQGIYVTYKKAIYGINIDKYSYLYFGDGVNWIDYLKIFDKTIESYSSEYDKVVGDSAFAGCSKLTNVNLPNVECVYGNGFKSCSKLTNVNLPNVEWIYTYAFMLCTSLISINLPNATTIQQNAFSSCTKLESVYLGKIKTLNKTVFGSCSKLADVYLGYNGMVEVKGTFAPKNSLPVNVHVRSEYLTNYQNDSKWSTLVNDGYVTLVGDYTD